MDFLSELSGSAPEFRAGDESFLDVAEKGKQTPQYQGSDIPGYVNPVVNGTPDTSRYVTAADAEQAAQAGIEATAIPREQALAMVAKADGIQEPTAQEAEAALEKRKTKAKPKAQSTRFDYPA